jgi:molybdate transport repressor ModE-like protein
MDQRLPDKGTLTRLIFSMAARSIGLRWLGVELRHLLALKTVAEEKSLAAAARRLGYSQPAISQQISSLEQIVGSRLVERRAGGREIEVTEAGARVLAHGAAMLARARAADAELRALQEGSAGTVRLGTSQSIGARVVPELLRRLDAAGTAIALDLVEASTDEPLLLGLEAGELELAFAFAPLRQGPFADVELLRDPYVMLVSRTSPLAARRRPLSLRQLAKTPLIVCRQGDAAEAFCRAHGIDAQIRYRIEDNELLVSLAAAGVGAVLVPQLAISPQRTDVVAVELAVKPPSRSALLVTHQDREPSQAVRVVIDSARTICAELAEQLGDPTAAV